MLNFCNNLDKNLVSIADKVFQKKSISVEDGLYLFHHADIGFLSILANFIRESLHGDFVFFNRNFHIEPTNICVFDCKFCSYSRLLRKKEDPDAWELTSEEILEKVSAYPSGSVTEVHIVGGVHPKMNLSYFANLLREIKSIRPELHIKGFTAVELEYMCRKAKVSYREGLIFLQKHGLDSIPGGGAEIFEEHIREKICADKCTADQWLEIHQTAHSLGMPSNATMLYGHIENYEHRLRHMERLRDLQHQTKGFNTFIPLKFRNQNNQMSNIPEVSIIEDIKLYAISRIFMDNFPHIKVYWPMLGREKSQLMLDFGVDDLDGTIDDSTKIYSMAGSQETNPVMSVAQIVQLIRQAGRVPVERDSVYNPLRTNFD